MAWDERLRRVTYLDYSGSVTRQTTLAGSPANPTLLRPLLDGRLIVVDHQFNIPESGMQQQFMEAVLYSPTGEIQDSVGRFPFARMGQIGERGRGNGRSDRVCHGTSEACLVYV